MIIHTDKQKTKEKEKQERDQQRLGKEPVATLVTARFTNGLHESPDVNVQTTSSGSMTQEIFFEFAKQNSYRNG